jgi:stage II sporulation protein D
MGCEEKRSMNRSHFAQMMLFQAKSLVQTGTRSWILSICLWLVSAVSAQAGVEMRVAIDEGVNRVTVGSSTKAIVRDANGREIGEIAPANGFVAEAKNSGVKMDRFQSPQIWVEPTAGGFVYIGNRWYRGRALVLPTSKGLTAINYVNLEQYLYSVLGSEMFPTWPKEALKAQAVVARSYALFQRNRSSNGVYDMGDTAGWQVYGGIEKETNTTQEAVNSTVGQVLIHKGQIIEAVFHSSSGGHTENVEHIWVQTLPYLKGVPDYDQISPEFSWLKTIPQSELSGRISGVGNILSMVPEQTTPRGRVMKMRVVGEAGIRIINGDTLRNALDLKSTKFEALPEYGSVSEKSKNQAVPVAFQFKGSGFGHGLGLSQWGAYSMAQRGADYRQIVLHYYMNTMLAKIEVK